MKGRKTALRPLLTPTDREALTAWLCASPVLGREYRRARLLILIADGMPIVQAARQVGMTRKNAYRWLRRWHQEGIAGLSDRPHPPRKAHDGICDAAVLAT